MHEDAMPVRLGNTREDQIWTFVILGAGGLLLFLVAPLLADWLASVPVVPFKSTLDWVGSFTQPEAWVVRPLIGLLVGLVLAAVSVSEEYALEVSGNAIVVVKGDDRRSIAKEAIVGIYREGKKIRIDGREGRVLFDEKIDAPRDRVASTLTAHGYPWETA